MAEPLKSIKTILDFGHLQSICFAKIEEAVTIPSSSCSSSYSCSAASFWCMGPDSTTVSKGGLLPVPSVFCVVVVSHSVEDVLGTNVSSLLSVYNKEKEDNK